MLGGITLKIRKVPAMENSGNSNSHRSTTPIGGRPKPGKGNGGDMQHPRKDYAKSGRGHCRECRQGIDACFGCGKSEHMVKNCPQKEVRLEVMLSLGLS